MLQNNPPSTPPEADMGQQIVNCLIPFITSDQFENTMGMLNPDSPVLLAAEQIETLLNSALIKELTAIELMRSWELMDEDFAKYLHEHISRLRGKE